VPSAKPDAVPQADSISAASVAAIIVVLVIVLLVPSVIKAKEQAEACSFSIAI